MIQEKFRESVERYVELFDNIKNGVAVFEAVDNGEDFVFVDFNKAGERIDGLKKERLIGQSVTKMFPGIKEFGLLDVFKMVFKTGKPQYHRGSIYKDERIEGWRSNFVYKLSNSEVVAVYEDITEQKKTEEFCKTLKQAKEIMDAMPDVITVSDMDGKITKINREGLKYSGYSIEEVLGKTLPEKFIMDQKEIDQFGSTISEVIRGEGVKLIEVLCKCKDGTLIPMETSLSALKDERGKTISIIAVHRDITQRKKAEEELKKYQNRLEKKVEVRTEEIKENKEKYRLIVESSTSLIVYTDISGTYLYVNPAAAKQIGKDIYEIIGKNIHDIHPPEQAKMLEQRIKKVIKSGAGDEYEDQVDSGTEKRWFRNNIQPVRDSMGNIKGVQIISDDINDKKMLENGEKKVMENGLRHAGRLATIGQLAAGIAHELNEPIGNILGFAELSKKEPGLPEASAKDMDKIIASTLYARAIIKNLLTFARREPAKKTVINLNEVVQDGIFLFESICSIKGIEIKREYEIGLPDIIADRMQINQVVVNLINNAIAAMKNGGTLTIKTSLSGEMVILTVEDTGGGMDNETLKKIFDPFFTTKLAGQGTGLGLSIVDGIVSNHGGAITVNSKHEKGTRFEISFPLSGMD